jgi:hypothetical protein
MLVWGEPGARATLAEIFFLDRAPRLARVAAAGLVVAIAIGWGVAALALHEHEVSLRAAGAALSPIGRLFADASSPLTVWPGWVAAALFALSASRLRHGPVEPPTGPRGSSVARLRAGLRREYLLARIALVFVTLLALLDLGRLMVSGVASMHSMDHAAIGLGWMVAEAAGFVAAAAALLLWVVSFRDQLGRLGALPDGSPPPHG